MQKNNFENNIEQAFADFQLQPSEAVWKLVEQRLAKKKRERKVFFWLFFAGLILLSGSVFLFITNKTTSELAATKHEVTTAKSESQPSESEKTLEKEKKATTENNENDLLAKKPADIDRSTGIKRLEGSSVNRVTNKSKINNTTKESIRETAAAATSKAEPKLKFKVLQEELALKAEKDAVISKRPAGGISKEEGTSFKKLVSDTLLASVVLPNQDSAQLGIAFNLPVTIVIKDSSIKAITPKTIKKWKFGSTLNVGVSDNIRGIKHSTEDKSLPANFSSSPSQNVSTITSDSRSYKSNLAIGAGFFVQHQLKGRLAGSFGLHYQYYSVSTNIGNKVNTTRTFMDSATGFSTTVNSYYTPGSASSYVNKYHFVQLPVNLLYRLNRNSYKPTNLWFGITPGFLMHSNSLSFDDRNGVYYRAKGQLNKFQLAVQSGISFPLINASKYNVVLGPQFQYSISNLTRPSVGTKEHLIYSSIKANILFKK
ncbi:MAG: hypothetical protein JWQ96_2773 [Segetibacter sp.]|nr:hypothetical protein [Segetibacter sp.]